MTAMAIDEKKPTSIYIRRSEEHGSTNKPVVMELRLASLQQGVELGAIWRTAAEGGRRCTATNSIRKVRLNGHFISSDQDGVSTVTWRDLVSFFSSRGYPDGLHRTNPITVSFVLPCDKDLPSLPRRSPDSVRGDASICLKRTNVASTLEDEARMNKKPRYQQEEQGGAEAADEASVVDHSILSMKRKLKLDDEDDVEQKRLLKKRIIAAIASHKAPASCSEAIRLFALQTATSTGN